MSCFAPLDAWSYYDPETLKRQISFGKRPNWDTSKPLTLPCGRCIGCRLDRSLDWATRIMHEASLYDANSFLTLTYDDKHLPKDGSLCKRDYQLFIKRLRKECGPLRYFHCGEYGETYFRPHYHVCLFGQDFARDRERIEDTPAGFPQYTSELLSDTWGAGRATISELTFESAAYVARYTLKKVHSSKDDPDRKERHYNGRLPEYITMSQGIGKGWLEKYGLDNVYSADHVIVRGKEMGPPPYYDKILGKLDPERLSEVKKKRMGEVPEDDSESSCRRLVARRRCVEFKVRRQLKRRNEG